MALPDKLQELLSRRNVEEPGDDEDVEVEGEGEEEVEGTTDTGGDAGGEEEQDVGELAAEVARHLNLDTVLTDIVRAMQHVDESVEKLSGRMDGFEQFAAKMAEDEPERVRSFLKDPNWHTKLFSVRTAEGDVDEDEEKDIEKLNSRPEDAAGDVFSATRIDKIQ